jgi:cytochrome b pre-mRNA-processing protein 3
MFQSLFSRTRAANRRIADDLYGEIVAAARQESLYSRWDVPDSPLGRFEMLSLHMVLFQQRMRDRGDAARGLSQTLIDEFFRDVEHSLRELGIGDIGVPKRMKKLASMYYGRAASYVAAIGAGDEQALAAALSRNVRPTDGDWPQASALARYVIAASAALESQPLDDILAGRITFPDASVEPIAA